MHGLKTSEPGTEELGEAHRWGPAESGFYQTAAAIDPFTVGAAVRERVVAGALTAAAATAGVVRVQAGMNAKRSHRYFASTEGSRQEQHFIGRPTPMWDLDLQLTPASAAGFGAAGLRLGDLVAITDIDARFNAGYRRGWVSVGLVVRGGSPQPGHGPGVTVIFSGPDDAVVTHVDAANHRGLCEETVLGVAASDR